MAVLQKRVAQTKLSPRSNYQHQRICKEHQWHILIWKRGEKSDIRRCPLSGQLDAFTGIVQIGVTVRRTANARAIRKVTQFILGN
jgi:hypothetical protein